MRGWVGSIAGLMMLSTAGAAGGAHLISSGPSVVETSSSSGEVTEEAAATTSTTTTTSTSTTSTTTSTTVPDDDSELAEEDAQLAELLSCTDDPVLSDDDPIEDWATIVLDPVRGIVPDFEPADLVEINPAGVPGEVWVREIVREDLLELLADADDAGAPLTLVSGYRSYHYQETLYNDRMEQDGEHAGETTARPGHSEHQLGTTIDVLTPGMIQLSSDFGETPAGEWLMAHSADYGFVVSYPAASKDVTCYEYEPWHIRYVGRDIAAEIRDSGLAPREWMLRQAVA